MRSMHAIRQQRGLSLVEVTIVMIIAALVATAAVIGYQGNQRRNEIRENITQVIEIAADLQRKFGISNQYGQVTTAIAVRSRTIPGHLRAGPEAAQNSYGGAITVAAVELTTANDAVALTWSNVPQSQCADLVLGAHAVARRIRINETAVKLTDAQQVNAATLTEQCDGATRVNVIFDVGRTTAS